MGRLQGPLPPPKLLPRSPGTAHLFPGGGHWEIRRTVATHVSRTSPWDQDKKLEQLKGPRKPNGQGPGPPPLFFLGADRPPPLSTRVAGTGRSSARWPPN